MSSSAARSALPAPPAAPRPVPAGAMGLTAAFLLLFGGIFGLVGTLLTVVFTFAGGPVWDDWILDDRGVRAAATPTGASPTGSRVNHHQVFEIALRFTDRAGKSHHESVQTAEGATVAAARSGTPIAIQYDPEDTSRVRVVGGSASMFGVLVVIPLAFAAVGLPLLLIGAASARRRRALYRDGVPALARVVSVEGTSSRVGYRQVMRMLYEVEGPSGVVSGSWQTVAPAAVGERIWVLCDPARTGQSIPVRV